MKRATRKSSVGLEEEASSTWELQLTSEELELDIIRELIAAQNDGTDVTKPECPSFISSVVDDDKLRIRHRMDKQMAENGWQNENFGEGHEIQDNNLVRLRAPEKVLEDATGWSSTSCSVSKEPSYRLYSF